MINHLPYSDLLETQPIAQFAPATVEIPIIAGHPVIHRTRYVKRSLWRRLTTSPFAADVREHGSSAWMVAMASLPMSYAVAQLLMGNAR